MKKQTNIKHTWSLIAESSVVDQQSNNISIHKVLEQLKLSLALIDQTLKDEKVLDEKVSVPFPFQIISMWRRKDSATDSKANVEIDFLDPNKKVIQNVKFELKFEDNKPRMRTIIASPFLNVTTSGLYLFKIKLQEDGEKEFSEVSEIPFDIVVEKS
jgi:hypothetical protein